MTHCESYICWCLSIEVTRESKIHLIFENTYAFNLKYEVLLNRIIDYIHVKFGTIKVTFTENLNNLGIYKIWEYVLFTLQY